MCGYVVCVLDCRGSQLVNYHRRTKENSSKAILVQAWTRPKSSKMLRLPDFKTLGT
jgi:hypothetical protein